MRRSILKRNILITPFHNLQEAGHGFGRAAVTSALMNFRRRHVELIMEIAGASFFYSRGERRAAPLLTRRDLICLPEEGFWAAAKLISNEPPPQTVIDCLIFGLNCSDGIDGRAGSTTVIFDLDFVAARLLVRTPPPFNAVQRNYWDARGRANILHPGDVFPSTGFVELLIL